MSANIPKTQVIVETTHRDIGKEVNPPTRKAAAIAVIENPFAGTYTEDLSDLMDIGATTLREYGSSRHGFSSGSDVGTQQLRLFQD